MAIFWFSFFAQNFSSISAWSRSTLITLSILSNAPKLLDLSRNEESLRHRRWRMIADLRFDFGTGLDKKTAYIDSYELFTLNSAAPDFRTYLNCIRLKSLFK